MDYTTINRKFRDFLYPDAASDLDAAYSIIEDNDIPQIAKDELLFHRSWDWLEVVLQKLQGMNFLVDGEQTSFDITRTYGWVRVTDEDQSGIYDESYNVSGGKDHIGAVCKAVYDILCWLDRTQPEEKKKAIEADLIQLFSNIGCDRPSNFDEILEFVVRDVEETADPVDWHSGDVAIAFRRWIEVWAENIE